LRRTKEDAELTRQMLLNSALKVFADKGYASTRLSDIADDAGVTRGALYWHFGGKKDVLLALINDHVDPFFERISRTVHEQLPITEKLVKVLRISFEVLDTDNSFIDDLHLQFMEMKMRKEIPELKSYVKKRAKNCTDILYALIEKGIAAGEFKNVNAGFVTTFLTSVILGIEVMAIEADLFEQPDKESTIELLLNGLIAA
jgi:TetR/AcrR family transcriptional regulator, acrAB operon repressor